MEPLHRLLSVQANVEAVERFQQRDYLGCCSIGNADRWEAWAPDLLGSILLTSQRRLEDEWLEAPGRGYVAELSHGLDGKRTCSAALGEDIAIGS